jgi:hypothetical protein
MSIFKDQQIALLTQHGKEQAIASILEPALGCVIRQSQGLIPINWALLPAISPD